MAEISRADKARNAYQFANAKLRPAILAQGELRVQAMLAASVAQQQRLSQAAVFLVAAAALAAQLALGEHLTAKAHWTLITAACVFAAGAISSAWGLRSIDVQLPGHGPAWWAGVDVAQLDDAGAEFYRIDNLERVLETTETAMSHRRKSLHFGLGLGCIAVCMLPVAAALN